MVRIIAVSDLHGELGWLPEMLDRLAPDLLICAGDWGDPGTLTADQFRPLLDRVHLLTIFGNHDDREMLGQLRNRDGTPALLAQGEARRFRRLVIAGISGIWAKTRLGSQLNRRWEAARRRNPDLTLEEWLDGRPMPPYVTDEDVRNIADSLARRRVDILISHACPGGLADRIPTGSHGGQRCYREAFEIVRPRIMVCGHLHQFQRDERRDGRLALNTGFGGEKEGWLICWQGRHYEATPIAEPRSPKIAAEGTPSPAAATSEEPAGAAPERQSERQARPAPRAPEPAGAARPHGGRQQQPRSPQGEAARALSKGQRREAGRATDTSQRRGGQPQPGVTASLAASLPAAGLAGVRSVEAAPLQAPPSEPGSLKSRRPRRRRGRRPGAPAQMPAERGSEPQAAAPSASAAAAPPAPSAASVAPPSADGDGRKEFAKSANTFLRRRRRRGGNRPKASNVSTSSIS